MSASEIQALYKKYKPLSLKESKPQYTFWQLKMPEFTCTAYTSGKVLFQGKDIDWLADDKDKGNSDSFQSKNKRTSMFPMAGSDEVGTGDFFGPVVVAGCIVEDEETAKKLKEMQIDDSKKMTDEKIRKVAPKIKNMLPYSICILNNPKYNKVHDEMNINMNGIKSALHNQVYVNLKDKGYELPKNRIIDQFVKEEGYYKHLKNNPSVKEIIPDIYFETKAESKYIAVAAASVLARDAFLEYMDKMGEKYDFSFERGAGVKVDRNAGKFLSKHSKEELSKVAKIHFANTKKAEKYISKS